MAGEEKTEQKKKGPSPVLLVILVLALGFVVYDFLTGERSTEPVSPQTALERRVPRVIPPLPAEEKKEEEKREITAKPSRDPFLPPAGSRKPVLPAAGEAVAGEKDLLSTLTSRISDIFAPEEQKDQKEPGKPVVQLQPVWTGTMATAEGRVVIIRHNNKSYILQLGQTLPGTDYRLVEIKREMLVLQAPGKELRLRRKEEAE